MWHKHDEGWSIHKQGLLSYQQMFHHWHHMVCGMWRWVLNIVFTNLFHQFVSPIYFTNLFHQFVSSICFTNFSTNFSQFLLVQNMLLPLLKKKSYQIFVNKIRRFRIGTLFLMKLNVYPLFLNDFRIRDTQAKFKSIWPQTTDTQRKLF